MDQGSENGQLAIPCPGPPCRFPGLLGSDPSLIPHQVLAGSRKPGAQPPHLSLPEIEPVTLSLPEYQD